MTRRSCGCSNVKKKRATKAEERKETRASARATSNQAGDPPPLALPRKKANLSTSLNSQAINWTTGRWRHRENPSALSFSLLLPPRLGNHHLLLLFRPKDSFSLFLSPSSCGDACTEAILAHTHTYQRRLQKREKSSRSYTRSPIYPLYTWG